MTLMFYANSNIILSGISQSGKTTLVLEIIKRRLISPWPKDIYFCYSVRQNWMNTWNKDKNNPSIKFIEGLKLDGLTKDSNSKLLILDDLMTSALQKDVCNLFIYGSHHHSITTIFITHTLFLNNECYRIISNNAHYILVMKNKRNTSSIATLARQILGKDASRILEGYKYMASQPYGFLVLSLHPKVPEELLVITDFLQPCPSIFL